MGPLGYIQIGVAAVAGALIATGPVFLYGKSVGRVEIEAAAARDAVERMAELEKSNESFKKLSSRDRCIVFMRDSRLPTTACD